MKEIERKFIVKNSSFFRREYFPYHSKTEFIIGSEIEQGYFENGKVRIRIIDGTYSFLTIKNNISNISRYEFEYEIPIDDAYQMTDLFCNKLEKTRYKCKFKSRIWEVDIFKGENEGLQLAEIELESENEEIVLPDFIGEEVTGDKRYYNSYLAKHPFSRWKKK